MRICSCEHPKMIYSKELNQFIRVSCGKCAACQNQRVKKWVNRLDQESFNHKYTFFVTLTYNDENLPAYFYSEDMQYLEGNRESLVRIPINELHGYLDGNSLDYDYVLARLVHPLGLPVICPKDLSDFFKRFNKYCYSHVTHHYQNIRYFACWEYGPATYRPHLHLLCWFDDKEIANRFDEILHSTWTFGYFNASAVFSNGGRSYVAKYVNKSANLPKVYFHPKFATKAQFSKCPSIGTLPLLDEEIRYYFYRRPTHRTIWESRSSKYVTIPIDECVKSRFFPKCPEYYKRSHYDRVTLYGVTALIPSGTFAEFRDSLDKCQWLTYRGIANDDEKDFAAYYQKLKDNAKNVESLVSSLYRFYRISSLVCWNSQRLGISVDVYVSGIEDFYSRIDYENLKCQLQFEQDYVQNHHSLSDLIHMFPDFSYYVEKLMKGYKDNPFFKPDVPSWLALAMDSFGILSPADYRCLEDTHDFRALCALHKKINQDSYKRNRANAYREKQLAVTDVSLSNILNCYSNG